MKILLMEDDPVLADILVDFLREHWEVDHVFNSHEANNFLEQNNYDLYVFDINVAGQSGLELLAELREFHNTTPTIFITAYKDIQHLTKAFELGAHDYIKKPFELDELYVRIANIIRLFNLNNDDIFTIADSITFNPKTNELTTADTTHTLAVKNAHILTYFLQHPNRLITNEELLQNIWDFDTMPSEATLRSHIRDLRNLIGKERIKTVRAQGYIYE